MKRVFLGSPYAPTHESDTRLNIAYLHAAMRDCISRGEAPLAPHGLYPHALDDTRPNERQLGLMAGMEWLRVSEYAVFYIDLGVSPGMADEIALANSLGIRVETRTIPGWRGRMGLDS